ncbi:HAD family hydrolase [Streptomyces sp. MB09-02B]|uniref:HAD family hydrolase n=1 Tax=Streptomyces sp. MB09-02B TaxID=3028667 RepID=UPI0029B244BB|nr:HAD family hydrolase [Streptomyces sp. MB09-02B]MDX3646338.1 HAD family hydrolase [Streptomyces sp. MB09-02B]
MRYDLVIFDNDGVLVDSESISNRLLAAFLTELGHPTSYEESIRDYMGSAMHRVHELVLERTGRPLPEDFDDVFHSRVFAAFERELKPVPAVVEVLEKFVADDVPFCVASSGSHERIRVGHRTTGLDRWFGPGLVFSAQDVGRGKPEPDLFLYAAARMGVAPERCVVVEDSPAGVRAGVSAGMDVYGFTAMTPADKLVGAKGYFSDMEELLDLLS